MNRFFYICVCFFIAVSFSAHAQGQFNLPEGKTEKIRFNLTGNLIVFPLELNGVELNFILDSGVSKTILFSLTGIESLTINDAESFYFRGLGSGELVEAYRSKNNKLRVGNAVKINHDIYLIKDSKINFAPRLGIPVHGIIGYDIFKDFIVEVNYASRFFRLHKAQKYVYDKCKKCETFPLSFNGNKPYIDAMVLLNEESESKPVKLLIDTGGSDALWLFEDKERNMLPRDGLYFNDYLGKGLSGDVNGKRSKVAAFELSDFVLNDANVAFPDSASISYARRYKERSGSISGEILKRFNIIFDYQNKRITLKKNKYFNSDFKYNNSGIVVEQIGYRLIKEKMNKLGYNGYGNSSTSSNDVIDLIETYKYSLKPSFTIVDLREDSPAKRSGLMKDDVIVSINGKPTQGLKLDQLLGKLSDKSGTTVRIQVDRSGRLLNFKFKLEDVFKRKALSSN